MNFKTSILRSLAITSVFGAALAAQAVFIDPVKLQTSTDLPSADNNVQQLLIDNGFTSSVGTSIPDYGDQRDAETFNLIQENAVWSILWQIATFKPTHKLGYYTNVGAGVINEADITWVLGDLDNDRDPGDIVTSSAPINLNGNNPVRFYSQTFRNADTQDHAATINALPVPMGYDDAVVVTWEDSLNQAIDGDYNDFGTLLTGVRPVPEPATLTALGLGALALIRRRAKK